MAWYWYAAGALVGTIGYQHAARQLKWRHSPAKALTYAATKAQMFWSWLGGRVAYLSRFLEVLKLGEIGYTIGELVKPTWDFAFAWLKFFSGYAAVIKNVDHKWLVVAGSLVLAAAAAYPAYQWCPTWCRASWSRLLVR